MTLRRLGALAPLVGCACAGDPPAAPAPAPVRLPPVVVPAPTTPGVAAQPVVEFENLSTLYRQFFSDAEPLSRLASGLAGCVDGPVPVDVSYDAGERVGRIVATLDLERLRCRAGEGAGGLDFAPLTPVTGALAAWRDELGRRRDLRIFSFRVGFRLPGGCVVYAGGPHPIDGTRFGPCLGVTEPGGAIGERCVGFDKQQGSTVFPVDDPEIAACLAAFR